MKRLRLVQFMTLLLAAPASAAVVGGSTSNGACTSTLTSSCAARGGYAVLSGSSCVCKIISYTPAYVSNADRGDVGLVPVSDGKGEEAVRVIITTLTQNHRHAVVYLDDHTIRHATSYPLTSDDISATTTGLRIKPQALMNAPPGAITQSTDEAMADGWNRLGTDGLVLKPGFSRIAVSFAGAATAAEEMNGYYKISDYSDLVGMNLPALGDPVKDDLRGTMCSGFVHAAFARAGFTITKHPYSQTDREQAALSLYLNVAAQLRGELSPTYRTLFPNGAEELANQVVNCFGGLSCKDTSPLWAQPKALGDGTSVSPDNLLPRSFVLRGTGSYTWDGASLAAGATAANDDAGALTTPFKVVEIQNTVGRVYTTKTLTSW